MRTGKQDAALLKRLADGGNPETQIGGIEALAARIKRRIGDDFLIALVDAAAGKYQRAGVKIDLIMTHHHEDLDFVAALAVDAGGTVAQQQDGGRRTRRVWRCRS